MLFLFMKIKTFINLSVKDVKHDNISIEFDEINSR